MVYHQHLFSIFHTSPRRASTNFKKILLPGKFLTGWSIYIKLLKFLSIDWTITNPGLSLKKAWAIYWGIKKFALNIFEKTLPNIHGAVYFYIVQYIFWKRANPKVPAKGFQSGPSRDGRDQLHVTLHKEWSFRL